MDFTSTVQMRAGSTATITALVLLVSQWGFAKDRCDFSNYKPLRIGASEGKVLKQSVKPEYPPDAKKHRVEGVVNVRVLFDADGIVHKACAISGHRLLRKAAEAATLKTLFEPVFINGKKVPYVEE